ncbi:FRG domain-containing protein [Paracoccus shanxieyensis]|uniref:FRG domain-containing protein n=1 Tax=Paracoccus shanxieyensis TaxID=2675752 RepID=UPI0018ACA3B9|nr:FRG domain-containing protein [Paracoccus shanxieyensis]
MEAAGEVEMFFRGHSSTTYEMEAGIFRKRGHKINETEMLYSIEAEAPSEFTSDRLTFDKLVRAQHYGLRTRLLDITTNPLIALYFASAPEPDNSPNSKDGHIHILKLRRPEIKYFASDTVSCIANLAYLSHGEKQDLISNFEYLIKDLFSKLYENNNVDLDNSQHAPINIIRAARNDKRLYNTLIQRFNDHSATQRLVQCIRVEKPHFTNQIDPADIITPTITLPRKSNARIAAQAGAFITYGLRSFFDTSKISSMPEGHVKLVVSKDYKEKIRRELATLGIDAGTVYPELSFTAEKINQRFEYVPP